MADGISILTQENFLNKVPLDAQPSSKPFTTTFHEFAVKSSLDAMEMIGKIYVPNFRGQKKEEMLDALVWAYENDTVDVLNARIEDLPENITTKRYRVYCFSEITNIFLRHPDNTPDLPVTFSGNDPELKKDIRYLLTISGTYEQLRKNFIEVFERKNGKLNQSQPGKENWVDQNELHSRIVMQRMNKMFMGGGEPYDESAADLIIGNLYYHYCFYLQLRARGRITV